MISITSSSFRALWNGIHQETLYMNILVDTTAVTLVEQCKQAKTKYKYSSNI
jgi:hypothetical protein